MSARRAVLSVPASEPAKIEKAYASAADEVVVDLEDAVVSDLKAHARSIAAALPRRAHGTVAVRVNGVRTPWFEEDVAALAGNGHIASIVVPKAETAEQFLELDDLLRARERATDRERPLRVQALIESPRGVRAAGEIAASSDRMTTLIIGYADLAASLGRDAAAPWIFVQDTVLFAARAAGIQAIDGPHLSVHDDEHLAAAADHVRMLGFDGKWVIHPRQIPTVAAAFTPTPQQCDEARQIIAAMDAAARAGHGAVEWQGRMLDEALVVHARRVLSREKGE